MVPAYCYSTVTLNCDLLTPKFNAFHLCPIIHHWWSLVKIRLILFKNQDIVLTSPESAVSSILHSAVILTFDLWPQIVMRSSLSHNASLMYVWWKYVKYTPPDIGVKMFRDTHMDACMHGPTGQNHYSCGDTTLGGGVKLYSCTI